MNRATTIPTSERLAVFETALAMMLWAVSFVFIKVALQEVSPVTVIVVRYSIGGSILLAAALARRELRQLRRSDLKGMALVGLVGITLQQLLQVSGQATAQAGVAAFLASTAPAFLVVLAAVFLRERLHTGQVVGVFLATAGAGMVSAGGSLGELLRWSEAGWGNLLVLLSAVVWAIFTILNRVVVKERPPVPVTAGVMLSGLAFTLPVFLVQGGWRELDGLQPATLGALLYVGVFSTALTYLLYAHALSQAEASRLAAIQNIEPVVAALAAYLILDEPLTATLLVGGAAILSGVTLAERRAEEVKP